MQPLNSSGYRYIDKNVNDSTTVCSLHLLRSLALKYYIYLYHGCCGNNHGIRVITPLKFPPDMIYSLLNFLRT